MIPQFERVADALFSAYATRQPIAPPRLTLPELDLAGAYAIQQFQERAFESQGHRVVGHKIGLTSLAMQQQLGVDSPDFGFFTDRMVYFEGDSIDVSQFIDPKIEPELAFRLGRISRRTRTSTPSSRPSIRRISRPKSSTPASATGISAS